VVPEVSAADRDDPPVLYVLVGLPASGKTTLALELAATRRALLLSPDEWMIPLFGQPDTDGRRDVLEGRMISLALQALRLGVSVALDFGVWARHERTALRALADQSGARCELVYLEVDVGTQRDRVAERLRRAPDSAYPISESDLAAWRSLFEAPDLAELSGTEPLDPPPEGFDSWPDWAADRWPSLYPASSRTGTP
jgi:predicted kinase